MLSYLYLFTNATYNGDWNYFTAFDSKQFTHPLHCTRPTTTAKITVDRRFFFLLLCTLRLCSFYLFRHFLFTLSFSISRIISFSRNLCLLVLLYWCCVFDSLPLPHTANWRERRKKKENDVQPTSCLMRFSHVFLS